MAARMIFRLISLLSVLSLTGIAHAATVTINVRGADGTPLTDAVVAIEMPGKHAVPRGPYVMEQRAIAFQPHILVVPVGATVSFPNRDTFRHHVYSFSKAKKFDLKLYGHDETRSVVFDRAGIVALGCNIHDSMNGFIVVSDTPYVVKTDRNGQATIVDVTPGSATIRVWSPMIRAPDNSVTKAVTIPPAGLTTTLSAAK